jgi:two-component system response regulator AtoC
MSTIEGAAEQLASTCCPILLVGPSGCGKHALAFRIYELSSGVNSSFLELNCVIANEETIAPQSRFLKCGTLFLGEVQGLNPVQLDILFDLYFGPGSEWSRLPRIIASSSTERCATTGFSLQHPFFACLRAGVVLRVPKLHERGRDVIALARHFVRNYADMFGRPEPELTDEMTRFFVEYEWPGNLDELEAACKTLVALGDSRAAIAALRASVLRPIADSAAQNTSLKQAARTASRHAEHTLIEDVLRRTGGNRKQAARQLQISYKALLYKLKQVGLSGPVLSAEEGEQA